MRRSRRGERVLRKGSDNRIQGAAMWVLYACLFVSSAHAPRIQYLSSVSNPPCFCSCPYVGYRTRTKRARRNTRDRRFPLLLNHHVSGRVSHSRTAASRAGHYIRYPTRHTGHRRKDARKQCLTHAPFRFHVPAQRRYRPGRKRRGSFRSSATLGRS